VNWPGLLLLLLLLLLLVLALLVLLIIIMHRIACYFISGTISRAINTFPLFQLKLVQQQQHTRDIK